MNWADLSKTIGPIVGVGAPIIGRMLGGLIPIPFGETLGQKAGELLASAFGVEPTPEAVHKAVTENPQEVVLARIKAAEAEAAARWPALALIAQAESQEAQVVSQQTGETARAELVSGTPWQRNWRPLNGYVTAALIAVFGLEIALAIATALLTGKLDVMNAVLAAVPVLVFYLSVPSGITGATSVGRSFEKVRAMTGQFGGYTAGSATIATDGSSAKVQIGGGPLIKPPAAGPPPKEMPVIHRRTD